MDRQAQPANKQRRRQQDRALTDAQRHDIPDTELMTQSPARYHEPS
jgi:hypothetical protein